MRKTGERAWRWFREAFSSSPGWPPQEGRPEARPATNASPVPAILGTVVGILLAGGAASFTVAFTHHYTDAGFVVNLMYEVLGAFLWGLALIVAVVQAAVYLHGRVRRPRPPSEKRPGPPPYRGEPPPYRGEP